MKCWKFKQENNFMEPRGKTLGKTHKILKLFKYLCENFFGLQVVTGTFYDFVKQILAYVRLTL